MRSVETEAATIDDAIAKALELLHVERDRVDVEILDNSSRGLLGFGTRSRIRATIRTPLFGGEEAPVSRETPVAPTDSAGVSRAEDTLKEILQSLGAEAPIHVDPPVEGAWQFTISGARTGIVIGRHGQTLDAIEYLLNRVASHADGGGVRIALDVEGYRERRRQAVEEDARAAAAKVRAGGVSVAMDPMSARDRRIVHLALGADPDVATRSEGDGNYRRVVIFRRAARDREP
jgi:spoIIIJ-associated protein